MTGALILLATVAAIGVRGWWVLVAATIDGGTVLGKTPPESPFAVWFWWPGFVLVPQNLNFAMPEYAQPIPWVPKWGLPLGAILAVAWWSRRWRSRTRGALVSTVIALLLATGLYGAGWLGISQTWVIVSVAAAALIVTPSLPRRWWGGVRVAFGVAAVVLLVGAFLAYGGSPYKYWSSEELVFPAADWIMSAGLTTHTLSEAAYPRLFAFGVVAVVGPVLLVTLQRGRRRPILALAALALLVAWILTNAAHTRGYVQSDASGPALSVLLRGLPFTIHLLAWAAVSAAPLPPFALAAEHPAGNLTEPRESEHGES